MRSDAIQGNIVWHERPKPFYSLLFYFYFLSLSLLRDNQNQLPYHLTTMSDDVISLPGSLSTIESGLEKQGASSGEGSDVASAARLLIQQDSERVKRSKLVVLLMIVIATIVTSIAVYKFSKESEEADFQVRVSST
jgi:hypothetical protein